MQKTPESKDVSVYHFPSSSTAADFYIGENDFDI